MTEDAGGVSFEAAIRPLFKAMDRQSMQFMFDLWDYGDVRDNAEAILQQLDSGSMPCYGPWPKDKIDLFRQWVQGGMPA
jgi:hypothetical protein